MSISTHPRRLLLLADRAAPSGPASSPVRRFRLARVQTAVQPTHPAPPAK